MQEQFPLPEEVSHLVNPFVISYHENLTLCHLAPYREDDYPRRALCPIAASYSVMSEDEAVQTFGRITVDEAYEYASACVYRIERNGVGG